SALALSRLRRDPSSFPTRRSSDLGADELVARAEQKLGCKLGESTADGRVFLKREEECVAACCGAPVVLINGHYHEKLTPEKVDRSEEHTSELQSRFDLVCRLLLEK